MGSYINNVVKFQKSELQSPIENFMYGLQSEEIKRQYPRKLKIFFDYCLKNGKDLDYQAVQFVSNSKDLSWANSQIINFIMFQRKRLYKGEIAAGTLRNYIKPVKLFCEMNDILLNWKKISRGMPKEKQYGDDRIPRIDEIHKLLQYPDRRIKPIVCLMISSGIRAGAWNYLKWKHIVPIKRDNQIIAAKIIRLNKFLD